MDSAADESVCPKDCGYVSELKEIDPKAKMRLTDANGGEIEY